MCASPPRYGWETIAGMDVPVCLLGEAMGQVRGEHPSRMLSQPAGTMTAVDYCLWWTAVPKAGLKGEEN